MSEGSPHIETGLRLMGSFAGVVIGMKPVIGLITLLRALMAALDWGFIKGCLKRNNSTAARAAVPHQYV